MFFRKKTPFLILALLVLLLAEAPLFAQSQKERIKSELYIMENILGQLLRASRDNWFNENRVQGVHLDDFGLLFTVNLESGFFSVGVVADGVQGDVSVTVPEPMLFATGKVDSGKSAEIMQKLDRKVRTFLGTYVDVNNHLDDSEKVGVLVFFDRGWHGDRRTYYYQAPRTTIRDYRNKRLSETQFERAITRDMADNQEAGEEVSIMATILESVFRDQTGRFRSARRVSGVHIKGLGVMYTMGTPANLEEVLVESFAPLAVPDREDVRELAVIAENREKERAKKWQEKISDYENKIVKLVGDYGASLRFLPDDQSVFVILGTHASFLRSTGGKHTMIRIKKSDVMSYSQSRIDLQALINRAQLERF